MQIRNLYCHPVTGEEDNSFVGLKIIPNRIDFYYPEAFNLSTTPEGVQEDVLHILDSIRLAKTFSNQPSRGFLSSSKGDLALNSYLWLINDFCKNGYYLGYQPISHFGIDGRINWKKTLQGNSIVSDGNIIYPKIISERKQKVIDVIGIIYRYCLYISVANIGWLFNLSPISFKVEKVTKGQRKYFINVIEKELSSTFDDLKRKRFTSMLEILTGATISEGTEEFVYGVANYYYVFERMVNYLLGTVKDMRIFNPSSNWYLLPNAFNPIPSSNLRPDTILIRNSDVFILDSKFYRYGHTMNNDDLPDSTSIEKQITYASNIETSKKEIEGKLKIKINHIYNAFILPYNAQKNSFSSSDIFTYIGFAKPDWINGNPTYGNIHTFLIDLRYLLYHWSKGNDNDMINKLVSDINKNFPIK